MYGKVLDIDGRQVYVEIDRQIRFKCPYRLKSRRLRIVRSAEIDFDILNDHGRPCLLITARRRRHAATKSTT
jgi:hypothetical protein